MMGKSKVPRSEGSSPPRLVSWPALLVVTLFVGFTGLALAEIEGSKHDFADAAWSGGDRCGACHVPHKSQDPTAAPLWNTNADLSERFGAAAIRGPESPGSGSLLCMRCHDGTIAKDTISGTKRERFAFAQHPGVFETGHGTSDHPVGIAYPQFDKGFHPASSVVASGAVTLPNDRVECTSCHDPHNQSGADHMLVRRNDRSALCLTCHKK